MCAASIGHYSEHLSGKISHNATNRTRGYILGRGRPVKFTELFIWDQYAKVKSDLRETQCTKSLSKNSNGKHAVPFGRSQADSRSDKGKSGVWADDSRSYTRESGPFGPRKKIIPTLQGRSLLRPDLGRGGCFFYWTLQAAPSPRESVPR